MTPVETPPTFETEFLTLNDDCIFVIFEWLPMDDLCTIGETCKRLHKLAFNQFCRKYPEKVMSELCLRVTPKGEITVLPYEHYIKYFSKYICNLKIQLMQRCTETTLSRAVEFMREKCNSNLQRIQFNCFDLPESFGTSIKDFLKTVEIVEFSHCNGQNNYYDSILKHCPKLQQLITDGCSHDTDMNGLFFRQHPKLEYFDYGFGNDFSSDKLTIFLQQNPNIKSLTWWLFSGSTTHGSNECIKCIVSNAGNLEYLYLSVTNSFNFSTICELRQLCDRDNFKRLEIQFLGHMGPDMLIDQGNELALLKKFSKVHLSASSLRYGLPVFNSSLHQINTVHVNSVCRDFILSDNDLLNVEELHFSEIPDDNSLAHFVRHLVKLKNIFIPKNLFFTESYIIDVLKLNVEREKLTGACPLVIYTNHPNNSTNFSCDLVKLKQAKFEKSSNIKFLNSFQMYSMVDV